VAMAVLALPCVTLAQQATFAEMDCLADPVSLGLMPIDAQGHLQFNPAAHTSVLFDAILNTDAPFHIGPSYAMSIAKGLSINPAGAVATGGDSDWVYSAPPVNRATAAFYTAGEYITGVGTAAGAGAGKTPAQMGAAFQAEAFSAAFGITYAGAGLMGIYEILPNVPLAQGDYYEISLWTDPYFNITGTTGQLFELVGGPAGPGNLVPFTAASVVLGIDIVPEPATALLLLGAIPFMRRRR